MAGWTGRLFLDDLAEDGRRVEVDRGSWRLHRQAPLELGSRDEGSPGVVRTRKPTDVRDLTGLDDGESLRGGQSRDNSLKWQSYVSADGARTFSVSLWDGRRWEQVIDDRVAAPKP